MGLQATRSFLVLLKFCLSGEGAVNPTLSRESCSRTSGCPSLCPGPRVLFVLKPSPYHLFFQCPLYFLVSYLHKRWGTVGCSLCSSVDWLGVSPMCRGKWNPLPLISPPSEIAGFIFVCFGSLVLWKASCCVMWILRQPYRKIEISRH